MKRVLVIGGGVIGLTTAWELLVAGFEVLLVEAADSVATGASQANGGQLSYRYVSPIADAGVALKALRWMFERDSPQQLRLEPSIRQWSWLVRFLANCSRSANRRTTLRLLRLGELSRAAFGQLAKQVRPESIALRTPGKLVIFRQARELARAVRAMPTNEPPNAMGEFSILDADGCVAREPALDGAQCLIAGGIFTGGEAVADCRLFCLRLLEQLSQSRDFRVLLRTRVAGFVRDQGRAVAVRAGDDEIPADEFVVAAGLHSSSLARNIGVRLPIYPVKGYSLTAPIGRAHRAPEVSVTDFERKVLYARIGEDLRIAALADLVGADPRVDPRRVASLLRVVRATLPEAADYGRAVSWAGLRPATPHGAPILGPSGVPGIWLNVGHGALGFTLATGSARVLAAMLAGREAPVPLDGLTLV
ncbi:D-amino acid dehydrogenase [Accumulibacter sp.]|uniref:D-amino acid dehydrogenase n=1 Tax=Accumulibacter sp. TaxID=2053492 RepID=UPI0025E45B31|nr:D-amino acid dehydrogenase [Accumulibacter sp.]MCM8595386.1 D-amino acid dehydrogenase [Accumulibacter sp.]MCM8626433.1 D-amino acid dehydrogenase [Accumulibacter sp.]MDS4049533.1 D-amino acid dehydrogenase [Accumulibacter sp.]